MPLLLNGDHLAVPEFERRYEAMPDIKRAELIEGIVIMSPPVSNLHATAHGSVFEYLKRYERATPGVEKPASIPRCGSMGKMSFSLI